MVKYCKKKGLKVLKLALKRPEKNNSENVFYPLRSVWVTTFYALLLRPLSLLRFFVLFLCVIFRKVLSHVSVCTLLKGKCRLHSKWSVLSWPVYLWPM